MEDEFESSARLLPAAEVKQPDTMAAVENELAESKRASEGKEAERVPEMLLLPFPEAEQADNKPAVESEPAESTPTPESKEEKKIPVMLLLTAGDTKPAESKPGVENQVEASKPESENKEENKVPELQLLPAAEEKQSESRPALEIKPVESKPIESKPVPSKAFERPFRVKLRGSVLVLVRLPNKRSVRAAIHQLSTSGGVIHFEKPLDEKLEVELIFHLQKATIRGKAQMLFPMWATQGWMQPFRFVNLAESSRGVLDEKLKSFLGEAKGAAAGA